MKDFLICITMDCWKFERGGFCQDTEEEEESVITYPHLRILSITSADNPRSNSPQFTSLNIIIRIYVQLQAPGEEHMPQCPRAGDANATRCCHLGNALTNFTGDK